MTHLNAIQDDELNVVNGGGGLKIGLGEGGGKAGNPGKGIGRKVDPVEVEDVTDPVSGGGTDVDYDNSTDGTQDQSSGLG